MKKAFEQNVSRAKPRLRMGAVFSEFHDGASGGGSTSFPPEMPTEVEGAAPPHVEPAGATHEADPESERAAQVELAAVPSDRQHPPSPPALPPEIRREKLKERLRAVREDPRPEPLPPTVAEAGVMAVERISRLQIELTKVKALNLALAQDLDGARRQSERATEEARLRMDEARRLSAEMEERAKLLGELEGELSSLEGERDESLLALQEARQSVELGVKEKILLREEIAKREQALSDSLSEEERLASELEQAKDDVATLRRAVDAVTQERDMLARQVADLTRERTELLEARTALQSVHRALSKAASR